MLLPWILAIIVVIAAVLGLEHWAKQRVEHHAKHQHEMTGRR